MFCIKVCRTRVIKLIKFDSELIILKAEGGYALFSFFNMR